MEKPLVSVIIPTYNGSAFLGETIDSVLAQTYSKVEVIVVNDGSTDGTASLLAAYGDRIRTSVTANLGTAAARNEGIRLSSGSLIAFLDHDDLWTPDKLEKQVQVMQADASVGMTHGGFRF